MKVRAIWEFEADVSDLDPKWVDIPGEAKDMTQRELADLLSKSEITAEDFEYEVVEQISVETCRERLKREHPDRVTGDGWCYGCPPRYGYLPINVSCMYRNNGAADCRACWSRPVKEVKTDEN